MMVLPTHQSLYPTTSHDDDHSFPFTTSAGSGMWYHGNLGGNEATHPDPTGPSFIQPYSAEEGVFCPAPAHSIYADVRASQSTPVYTSNRPSSVTMDPFSFDSISGRAPTHTLTFDEPPWRHSDRHESDGEDLLTSTTTIEAGSLVTSSPEEMHSADLQQPFRETSNRRTFPPQAVIPLREWFEKNINDAYPSKETKEALAAQTGLTFKQVNNWFINARKRFLPKTNDPAHPPTPMMDSRETSISHVHDPYTIMTSVSLEHIAPTAGLPFDFAKPTWLSPAPTGSFIGHSDSNTPGSTVSVPPVDHDDNEYTLFAPRYYGIPSRPEAVPRQAMTQLQAPQILPSQLRASPGLATTSAVHSPPLNSRHDAARTTRNTLRSAEWPPRTATTSTSFQAPGTRAGSSTDRRQGDDQQRRRSGEIFQCTFPDCHKSFGSKTWKRHEETKHLRRFQWTCMNTGFLVPAPPSPQMSSNPLANPFIAQTTPVAPRMMCAFCEKLDPDPITHPQECPHRIADCASRPDPERTFSRKDHLFQHLRNFHRMTAPDSSFGSQWKSRVDHAGKSWLCGFCGERLGSWDRRARHLRGHFKEGWRVETDWDLGKARSGHSHTL